MKRIFLCHSSDDKDFADSVAKSLGRSRVAYDVFSFAPGHDFREQIRSKLDNSGSFVFIASKNSLSSMWCKFELDNAEMRSMSGGIRGQLTLIIDRETELDDLPHWLRRSRVLVGTRVRQATREIQNHATSLSLAGLSAPIVGREEELAKIAEALIPSSGRIPRVLIARGLAGVGRRTVLARGISDNLSLLAGPYIGVESVSGADDVYLQLRSEIADGMDVNESAKELAAFQILDRKQQVLEIVELLLIVCRDRAVPIIEDLGGVLGSDGSYSELWQQILVQFCDDAEDEYIGFLHTRLPKLRASVEIDLCDTRVGPLTNRATVRLLSMLLRKKQVVAEGDALHELAEYVDGYPPAANFAANFASEYGLDVLLADKRELLDFKARRFQRFFEERVILSPEEWSLLVYLGGENSLDLTCLSVALAREQRVVAAALRTLMDLSLVQTVNGRYEVSAPVISALYRVKSMPSKEFYRNVAKRLRNAYWRNDSVMPAIYVVDATIHAATMAGQEMPDGASFFVRFSTILKSAIECYHRDNYDQCIEYISRLDQLSIDASDRRLREAREFRYKSLVKTKQWAAANAELEKIESKGDPHFFFLEGFGHRFRGELKQAIESYESALSVGDDRISVHRERAHCQNSLGRYGDAILSCNKALIKDANNPYVLDTLASAYLGLNDYKNAHEALRRLDDADVTKMFIYHRWASYFAAQKNYTKALEHADLATTARRARFEAHGQRINILIDAERYADAREALEQLTKNYPMGRGDVVIGLRCKSAVRQGIWREANNLWKQLEQKSLPVHQALLRSILVLKSEDRALSLVERGHARDEAGAIKVQIADFDHQMSLLTMSDAQIEGVTDYQVSR